jgi:ABC-2 type transport system ATP-binding protein
LVHFAIRESDGTDNSRCGSAEIARQRFHYWLVAGSTTKEISRLPGCSPKENHNFRPFVYRHHHLGMTIPEGTPTNFVCRQRARRAASKSTKAKGKTVTEISNGSIVKTEGLSKSYKGVEALNGLDLVVPEHSIFGFLGPNGSGKTTTIKLLLGLTQPTAGRASMFGLDSNDESLEIRRRVGYLGQDPRFFDGMTARQTLRFRAGFYYSGPSNAIEARIVEVLELVGMSDKADRPVKGFSGGERQRLGIGQALINSPELLILDEPAAALDPMGRRDVLDVMRSLKSETTVFYSTHILDDVQRVSDSVAILNRGNLVAQAPIEELLAGSDMTVYTIVLKGDATNVQLEVLSKGWVDSVEVTPNASETTLQVSVTDDDAAEAQLMRIVSTDEHVTVSEFKRKELNLEEVFMNLVEQTDDN